MNFLRLQSGATATRDMRLLGSLAAFIFAVAIPLLYVSLSVYALRESLMIETAGLAKTVEKLIQDRPDMWEFEQLRLLEIVSQPSIDGGLDERTIRTAAGTVVVKTVFSAIRPAITASAAFFDSGNPIGSIEARHSIRKQLTVTILLGMLSSLLGYLLFFIFRTYPIRRLENALVDLQRTQEEERQNRKTAERLAEEIAIIAYIGRVVGSTLNITQVFERVATEVRKLIHHDRLLVNLKKDDNEFVVVYSSGVENPWRRLGDSYPSKGSSTGVVMNMRSGILIQPNDAEEIKDLYPNLYTTFKTGLRSTMSVPLISMDKVIGSLTFRSMKLKAYTEQDLRLAERIGEQISGAIANAQMFNDLSKTEKALRLSQEHLQRAEKMEALGQLAGGVAHDLNNVLGILSGYSELLLEEIPEGHRSRGHVEKILQSTVKGAAIIQDLLTLARRGVTVSDVINLNNVVSGFLKTPVFEKMKDYHPRVTFRTECDKNILNIKGSPVHLEKTLMNLVSNAAESISGKGEVTIRTESRYLDKAVRGYDEVREGDYTVLTVSDTGMGIPAENREKIFEPFYTKKTMGRSGTGLGLSIVWGTVKDHRGYIDVQTEIGAGTTFTLCFPATREELIAQQQKAPIEQYMGNGESVLVVDDITEQRDVAARLLTRLGYEIHAVSSGEEAVEYLKGNKADILVLDMIMTPGIDGLETYQRVLAINPKQKAILVSGYSETDRVTEAQKLGAGAYVKKPYLMEKIAAAIRDQLNR
jgi:signal transduction histidine kinase/CheY-like chemotaxis protein